MSRSTNITPAMINAERPVGVGLRHAHFADVLSRARAVDFLEVHTENFFADRQAIHVLEDIAGLYPLSFHGTAMGLGSTGKIEQSYLQRLKKTVDYFNPLLLSDHACFCWSSLYGQAVHMGDLLPLPFNNQSLETLVNNVDHVQQFLGRQLLIENLVAYVNLPESTISEPEFFMRLVERTGCGLLVDLNNLLVNARNEGSNAPLDTARQWLKQIPASAVAELHLAGYSTPAEGELIVDDHSQTVSEECWQLYEYSLQLFDQVATLIEWDNNLPPWAVLLKQAEMAQDKLAANNTQRI